MSVSRSSLARDPNESAVNADEMTPATGAAPSVTPEAVHASNETPLVASQTKYGSRVYVPKEDFEPFSVDFVCPSKVLGNFIHNPATRNWWLLLFFLLCCLGELCIIFPLLDLLHLPHLTIYCLGVTMSGAGFWVLFTQTHCRAQVWHCLHIFDFWFLTFSYGTLIFVDSYAICVLEDGGWITLPFHVFQTVAIALTIFAIDACTQSRPVRAFLVGYYGFVLVGVIIMWRIPGHLHELGTKLYDVELAGLQLTRVQLAAIAQSTAMTCAIFMIRFGYYALFRNLEFVLIKGVLQLKVNSATVVAAATPTSCKPVDPNPEKCSYVPEVPEVVISDRPLVCSSALFSMSESIRWVVAAVFLSLLLFFTASEVPAPWCYLQYAAEAAAVSVFILHVTQYSVGVIIRILFTFDGCFLVYKSLLFATINAYRSWRTIGRWSILHWYLWLSFIALVIFSDASRARYSRNTLRQMKGFLYVYLAVHCGYQIISWRMVDTTFSDQTLSFYEFATTYGVFAQSSGLTIVTYCVRYAYNIVCRGCDTILVVNMKMRGDEKPQTGYGAA